MEAHRSSSPSTHASAGLGLRQQQQQQQQQQKKGQGPALKVDDPMRFQSTSASTNGALSQKAKKASSAKKAAQTANNKHVAARNEQNYASTVCAKNPKSSSCKKASGRAKKATKSASKAGNKAGEKYRKQGAAAAKKGDHAKAAASYNNANTYASGNVNMALSKKKSKGGSKGGIGVSVGVGVNTGPSRAPRASVSFGGGGMRRSAGYSSGTNNYGRNQGYGYNGGGMSMMSGGMGMMSGGMGMMASGIPMHGMNPRGAPYGTYDPNPASMQPIWDESEYGAWNDVKQKEFETQMMIGTTHTPYGQGNYGPGGVIRSGPRQAP